MKGWGLASARARVFPSREAPTPAYSQRPSIRGLSAAFPGPLSRAVPGPFREAGGPAVGHYGNPPPQPDFQCQTTEVFRARHFPACRFLHKPPRDALRRTREASALPAGEPGCPSLQAAVPRSSLLRSGPGRARASPGPLLGGRQGAFLALSIYSRQAERARRPQRQAGRRAGSTKRPLRRTGKGEAARGLPRAGGLLIAPAALPRPSEVARRYTGQAGRRASDVAFQAGRQAAGRGQAGTVPAPPRRAVRPPRPGPRPSPTSRRPTGRQLGSPSAATGRPPACAPGSFAPSVRRIPPPACQPFPEKAPFSSAARPPAHRPTPPASAAPTSSAAAAQSLARRRRELPFPRAAGLSGQRLRWGGGGGERGGERGVCAPGGGGRGGRRRREGAGTLCLRGGIAAAEASG